MRIIGHGLVIACAALLALGTGWAHAAERGPSGIPDRLWYPQGYRDLRRAADEQLKTFPRPSDIVVRNESEKPRQKTYDLIDCSLGDDLADGLSKDERRLSELALDIARMRSEFRKLGYRSEVYDRAVLEYERKRLAAIDAARSASSSRPDVSKRDQPDDQTLDDPDGTDAQSLDDPAEDALRDGDDRDRDRLAKALEAKRRHLQPGLPQFIVDGGCGGGESRFTVNLVPANGELWMINAFAFHLCGLKVADPWSHRACSWTQYGAGDNTYLSGRYMYEARWPDGTVKRGARIVQGDPGGEDAEVVTFRRN
ncbi:MAG TPA: hypothetical protein VID20_04570 [Sphingomicrobium sp.]|jgi:hypothetical protein